LFYTEEFKQKIVNEILSGKLNKRQASLIYGIKGNATILYWIKQSQGLKGYEKKAIPIANFAEMKNNVHDKKLEEENKELRELLRVAELRADLWQHAIETAEKKFNIDTLKKYGAQQSTPSKNNGQKKK
jgi:transposase